MGTLLLSAVSVVLNVIILIVVLTRKNNSQATLEAMERRLEQTISSQSQAQIGLQSAAAQQTEQKLEQIRLMTERQLEAVRATVDEKLTRNREGIAQELGRVRSEQASQLRELTQQTERRLEAMRATVDEKLQKTLEERIGRSFMMVSDRLEQVYKGLGEMQSLANGVGDLKRVLSGVKSRGVLGEIQLGAILEQLLSPEQYETGVSVIPNSRLQVEFAVKMPGAGDECVWLPIDSKFPYDRYHALCDAYDAGDGALVEAAAKELQAAVRQAAKDIHEKYIAPPHTTEFGILFLPFEGLYAEVVRRGMVESLQREFKINITGPTTMGAFLNSLQIGFRTLAIQKRSGEVWNLLGQVKTEFEKFGGVLEQAQKKLEQAGNELETLVGVRTRKIIRSLNQVEALDQGSLPQVLE